MKSFVLPARAPSSPGELKVWFICRDPSVRACVRVCVYYTSPEQILARVSLLTRRTKRRMMFTARVISFHASCGKNAQLYVDIRQCLFYSTVHFAFWCIPVSQLLRSFANWRWDYLYWVLGSFRDVIQIHSIIYARTAMQIYYQIRSDITFLYAARTN